MVLISTCRCQAAAARQRPFRPGNSHQVVCANASSKAGSTSPPASEAVSKLVSTIKQAAVSPGSVPPSQLTAAMALLEKQKLKPEGWSQALAAPDRRWKLVFTVPAQQAQEATKGKPATGFYWPESLLPACQKVQDDMFSNGVFFGALGHLVFEGPCLLNERKLGFQVTSVGIAVGPWKMTIPIDKSKYENKQGKNEYPYFFLYAYVDEDVVVARGRSGGLAVWAAAPTTWQAQKGILQVYK